MVVKIVPNDKGNPPSKLADAELHFTEGVLEGLKLVGFAVWERRSGSGRNVTFPSRQYTVSGDRRSFALLRPVADATSQERVRDLVLQAYAERGVCDAGGFVKPAHPRRRHDGWRPGSFTSGISLNLCIQGVLQWQHSSNNEPSQGESRTVS